MRELKKLALLGLRTFCYSFKVVWKPQYGPLIVELITSRKGRSPRLHGSSFTKEQPDTSKIFRFCHLAQSGKEEINMQLYMSRCSSEVNKDSDEGKLASIVQ